MNWGLCCSIPTTKPDSKPSCKNANLGRLVRQIPFCDPQIPLVFCGSRKDFSCQPTQALRFWLLRSWPSGASNCFLRSSNTSGILWFSKAFFLPVDSSFAFLAFAILVVWGVKCLSVKWSQHPQDGFFESLKVVVPGQAVVAVLCEGERDLCTVEGGDDSGGVSPRDDLVRHAL